MTVKTPVYMDYSATTPCDPRVVEKMGPFFTNLFGNAASRNHSFGWTAEAAPRYFTHPSDRDCRIVVSPGRWEWRLKSNDTSSKTNLARTGFLDGLLGQQTDVHVK